MPASIHFSTGRLFIVDPNIHSLNGHYLTYAASIATAARARGMQCWIFGHKDIDAGLAAAHGVAPVFRADIWQNATGGNYFDDANLEVVNRAFFEDTSEALERLDVGAKDTIFYPTNTAGQITGIADLVEHFAGSGVRHQLLLRYQADFYAGKVAASGFRRLEKASQREQVRISTDSHRLAYELGVHTILPIALFPIPHTVEQTDVADGSELRDRPLHLVSLGNARGEKGLGEIFEAIRLSLHESWGARLRFTLQVNDPSQDIAASVESFRSNPDSRTTLITETLGADAYIGLLRSADAVLVPYHRDIYEVRTSGVFLEASACGKIVLATADTWMADLVDAYGHGLLVHDRSPRDLARALRELVENSVSLAINARTAARQLRAIHNPDSFVDHLLGSEAGSAEPSHRRRAVIFYPWGDIAGRSGAAARTNLLAKYLTEKGRDVRILYLGSDDVALAPGIKAEGYPAAHWHASPLAQQIDDYIQEKSGVKSSIGVHLYYHIWPHADDAFKRRCLRLVRWADDIFVEYTYFAGVIGEMASQEGKSCIVTLHDLVSEILHDIEPVFSVTRAMELKALRHNHRIVISNEAEAQICAKEGFLVTVIPSPVDITSFHELDCESINVIVDGFLNLGVANRPVCLFVGSHYGPNRVAADQIRALAARANGDPRLQNVLFVIAGKAHDIERLENFVALGQVEDLVLEALYQIATIVLIPLLQGTGSSVKTVEALARGACIISTNVGVRGYSVVDGVHCVIEDDLARYPDRIAELISQRDQISKLRENARKFGQGYDYRTLFAGYGMEAISGTERAIKAASGPRFSELLPRLARGAGTPRVVQWLLGKLTLDSLSLDELVMLARSCHRLLPNTEAARALTAAVVGCRSETVDAALSKWAFIYEIEADATSCDSFVADLRPLMQAAVDNGVAAMRRHFWRHFETNSDDFIVWITRAIRQRLPHWSDPELSYVFALANERMGGSRVEVIKTLTAALAGGFNPGWILFHRGRLRLAEGDPGGRDDLERTLAMGGDAAKEASAVLAQAALAAAWRAYFAGRHAEAAQMAERLLAEGATDPAIHYLLGLSLHTSSIRLDEARAHYDSALEGGFDAAWVLFHRGRLRLSEGDPGGRDDLERALAMGGDPAKEARSVLAGSVLNDNRYEQHSWLMFAKTVKRALGLTTRADVNEAVNGPGLQECLVNGMRLKLPRDFIAMLGHCRVSDDPPTYFVETAHMEWAVDHLPVGGTAIDIGASGGLFTAAFSRKVGRRGKVYTFEPARRAQSFLRSVLAQNGLGNVTLETAAISDAPGQAAFHELPSDDACPWRPEASALEVKNAPAGADIYEVSIVTIDGYFSPHIRKVDLLKIDIEGFEVHALRGGLETLSRHKPFLCIDIHARLSGEGDTEEDVREILSPLGYTFERRAHVLLCFPRR